MKQVHARKKAWLVEVVRVRYDVGFLYAQSQKSRW